MHHTGTLYLGKHRPTVGHDATGAFRLEMVLVDNLGRNPHTGREEKEAYRVHWAGPAAQAFWATHEQDLTPGAALRVELERVRAHVGATFPPLPELQARMVRAACLPRRASAECAAHANQEQAAATNEARHATNTEAQSPCQTSA